MLASVASEAARAAEAIIGSGAASATSSCESAPPLYNYDTKLNSINLDVYTISLDAEFWRKLIHCLSNFSEVQQCLVPDSKLCNLHNTCWSEFLAIHFTLALLISTKYYRV